METTENTKAAAQDIESAKRMIAEAEKQELDTVGAEVGEYFTRLNERGYAVLPTGQFIGNNLRAGWQVVKISATNNS